MQGQRPPAPPLPRSPPPRPSVRPLDPAEPVTTLPYLGEGRARLLARLGLTTLHDLLYHLPIRHEDYTRTPPISGLVYGQLQTAVGRFTSVDSSPVKGGRVRVVARLEDHTGAIRCTWFWPAQMARNKRLPVDELVVVSGKVGQFNGVLAFEQPDYEAADADLLHVGRLVPIYGATEGLYQKQLRAYARAALEATATTLVDPLPAALRQRAGLPPLHPALSQAHFPANEDDRAIGRRRLALDELLLVQLGMQRRRLDWQREAAPALPLTGPADEAVRTFLDGLPFRLTRAQRRALDEVLADAATTRPMSRLVQGDVGSGKTVVAAAAMLAATAHGFQAAIMAPTEILAEQHARNLALLFSHLPDGLRPEVALLKGSLTKKQKGEAYARIAAGEVQVVAGTHAVIQAGVDFRNLALAVIDEQHRFGVAQRASLRHKGSNPHLLVMTATPIPRSLALTMYGDLDVSIIDELPPGRQPIETRCAPASRRDRAYDFIRARGRRRPAGIHRLPAGRGVGGDRGARGDGRARAAPARGLPRSAPGPAPRADAAGREGRGHARVPGRRVRHPRLDGRDRGRHRHPERDGHAHRRRRSLRPRATAPVSRPGRPRRAPLRLPAALRRRLGARQRAPAAAGRDDRRLRARRARPAAARAGRVLRRPPVGPAAAASGRPGRHPHDRTGAEAWRRRSWPTIPGLDRPAHAALASRMAAFWADGAGDIS